MRNDNNVTRFHNFLSLNMKWKVGKEGGVLVKKDIDQVCLFLPFSSLQPLSLLSGFSEYILTTCRDLTAASRGLVRVYENACHWLYCTAYRSRQEQTRKRPSSLVRIFFTHDLPLLFILSTGIQQPGTFISAS